MTPCHNYCSISPLEHLVSHLPTTRHLQKYLHLSQPWGQPRNLLTTLLVLWQTRNKIQPLCISSVLTAPLRLYDTQDLDFKKELGLFRAITRNPGYRCSSFQVSATLLLSNGIDSIFFYSPLWTNIQLWNAFLEDEMNWQTYIAHQIFFWSFGV